MKNVDLKMRKKINNENFIEKRGSFTRHEPQLLRNQSEEFNKRPKWVKIK